MDIRSRLFNGFYGPNTRVNRDAWVRTPAMRREEALAWRELRNVRLKARSLVEDGRLVGILSYPRVVRLPASGGLSLDIRPRGARGTHLRNRPLD